MLFKLPPLSLYSSYLLFFLVNMVILALRLSPSSKKLRQNTFYFCPFFEEPPLRVVLFSLRGVFNIFRWRSCYSLEKFAKDVCLCLRLPDMVKYLRLLLWFALQMRALVQGRIIVLGWGSAKIWKWLGANQIPSNGILSMHKYVNFISSTRENLDVDIFSYNAHAIYKLAKAYGAAHITLKS